MCPLHDYALYDLCEVGRSSSYNRDQVPVDDEPVTISMNAALHQFEAGVADHKAVLEYRLDGNSIVFTHTEVPYQVQRRGVGSALARAGLNYAREQGLTVLPYCPFIEHYIRTHPEDLPLVEPAYRAQRFPEARS